MTASLNHWIYPMSFAARLIAIRRERGLTQQGLADATDIHVQQIKRYEAGTSQPSAEALKKIAKSFSVTTDSLLFEEGERGPNESLRLQFEAVSAMSPEEQEVAKAVLDAMIVKNQVAGALERVSKPVAPAIKPKASARSTR